ncbi:MAG: hypothetical protein KC535_04145 [Nanoarchaeota archaeon]|nr:hypothetical protein [Nanoarchaeota archaeon]
MIGDNPLRFLPYDSHEDNTFKDALEDDKTIQEIKESIAGYHQNIRDEESRLIERKIQLAREKKIAFSTLEELAAETKTEPKKYMTLGTNIEREFHIYQLAEGKYAYDSHFGVVLGLPEGRGYNNNAWRSLAGRKGTAYYCKITEKELCRHDFLVS